MAALHAELYPRLKSWATSLVGAEDAEDVVQEAFLRFYRREDTRRPGEITPTPTHSLMQYVHDIAREQARQTARRRGATSRIAAAVSRFAALHVSSPIISGLHRWMHPGEELQRGQTDPVLLAAIDALPPRQRDVFLLVAGHELSYAEVGELLHIGASAARSNFARANAQLRALLAPWAGAREAQRGATRSTRVAADDATTPRTIAGRQGDA